LPFERDQVKGHFVRQLSSGQIDKLAHTLNGLFYLDHDDVSKDSYNKKGFKKRQRLSHTRYQALGPELIPVYRQSARRWP